MRRLPWGIISSISIQGVVFFFLERRPWEEKPRGHCPLRLQLRLSRGCDELYYGTDWRTGYPFFSLGSLSNDNRERRWRERQKSNWLFSNPPQYTPFASPNFAKVIAFKCSWENAVLPGAFKNNGLCKIWGANREYYGGFENRE